MNPLLMVSLVLILSGGCLIGVGLLKGAETAKEAESRGEIDPETGFRE